MARPQVNPRKDAIGDSLTYLCAGALALSLLLVFGLMTILTVNGMTFFWQKPLVELTRNDGTKLLGEIQVRESVEVQGESGLQVRVDRTQIKVGNRDITGADFEWVDEETIRERSRPATAVKLERLDWGNFYGQMVELRHAGEAVVQGADAVWAAFPSIHSAKRAEYHALESLERGEVGEINYRIERLNREKRALDFKDLTDAERARSAAAIDEKIAEREAEYQVLADRIATMRERLLEDILVMEDVNGNRKELAVGSIVRALRPNEMGFFSKTRLYLSRLWEFVSERPRESNTEGGIFPAIFGTVMMVFIMTVFVSPLGILAAVYLREYAKQGAMVRAVRIAVNNLAGVPSIVFGMFGLGFFVYIVGGTIDQLFYPEALPSPTFGTGGILWASLTLALLTVPVVIVATEEGLAAVPRAAREGSLALGATQFETTWKVVVPAAAPGILTGMILAMARAAGEVAPLMIVGMVKLAPDLPVDHRFPFFHPERKFMHLGFHIYDVGFQSPNVEATKPLVFATALLLVVVVTVMNLSAITLRNHLRRKYAGSAV